MNQLEKLIKNKEQYIKEMGEDAYYKLLNSLLKQHGMYKKVT